MCRGRIIGLARTHMLLDHHVLTARAKKMEERGIGKGQSAGGGGKGIEQRKGTKEQLEKAAEERRKLKEEAERKKVGVPAPCVRVAVDKTNPWSVQWSQWM